MIRSGFLALAMTILVWNAAFADSAPPPSRSVGGSVNASTASGGATSVTGGTAVSPSSAYQPQAEASFSGAFTWNYPIDIPAGTNGVQPRLSISYSSHAPNGILGMGFQLTGLSAIERDDPY